MKASYARELAEKSVNTSIEPLYKAIKEKAMEGKRELHVYYHLDVSILNILRTNGYEIYDHPSIAVQKDGLYYTISW